VDAEIINLLNIQKFFVTFFTNLLTIYFHSVALDSTVVCLFDFSDYGSVSQYHQSKNAYFEQ